MLTVEQMATILREVTLKREPSLVPDEALDFRENMVDQVAQIRAAGQEVEIPFD